VAQDKSGIEKPLTEKRRRRTRHESPADLARQPEDRL